MKYLYSFLIIVILIMIFGLTCCNAGNNQMKKSDTPYYYKSWSGYQIPFKPVNEISQEEANKLDVYYVAYFNEDGNLLTFTKYLHGKKLWTDEYIYVDSKLKSRKLIKDDGDVRVDFFDDKGNIKEK